jgi:hypothetical protein
VVPMERIGEDTGEGKVVAGDGGADAESFAHCFVLLNQW